MPNKFLADYCSFSRRELTGIAVLLGLIVALCLLPDAWEVFRKDVKMADTAGFHRASLELAVMLEGDTGYGGRYGKRGDVRFERGRYKDGGSADDRDQWYRSHGDRRYRDGGSGRGENRRYSPGRERQLENRHGTRERHSAPYGHRYNNQQHSRRNSRYERKPLDINTADTLEWERLPGIGPVLAKRIVLFRERLGGFHNIAQVGETYGLEDSVFVKIQPLLLLSKVSLRKIDLNKTDEKSLADHPYINTKLARAIIRYRSNHGPFSSVESLKRLALVDEVIYRKLEKYLVVN